MADHVPLSAENLRIACGVVLLREDGAALLQHRDNLPGLSAPDHWVFPGGGIHEGETEAECARRECREETGYDCAQLQCLSRFPFTCPDTGRRFSLSFWWSTYDGVTPVACFEGQEVRFVSRDAAPELLIPDYLLRVWDLALVEAKKTLPAA
jgi:8-oxo-dGTP pyrophosphatase MutT (NUDIX family)